MPLEVEEKEGEKYRSSVGSVTNALFLETLGCRHTGKTKLHPLGNSCALAVLKGKGCSYFIVHNSSILNIKVQLSIAGSGIKVNGVSGSGCGKGKGDGSTALDVVECESESSKLVAVVVGTGGAMSVHYEYIAELAGGGEKTLGERPRFSNGNLIGVASPIGAEGAKICFKYRALAGFISGGDGNQLAINEG